MQHWEVLIIPLIALVVWIIGTLFKSEDDKSKKGVRSRGVPSGRAPGRRPVTALDRFLEEARRRRETEEQPKPAPAPPPSRSSAPRPSRPREMPRVAVPAIPKPEVPVVVPVARPALRPVEAEPVVSKLRLVERTTPPAATPAAPRPVSSLQQVRALLSKPQTAATAFVLREIFDRPLCKRRRNQ